MRVGPPHGLEKRSQRQSAAERAREPMEHQALLLETRLNVLAREYGYRYRLDLPATGGLSRVDFVRTLREARFIGIPIRRSGNRVKFFQIRPDGTLQRHSW